MSQAPDPIPSWIPQLGMAFGAAVLAIALVDRLIALVRGASMEEGGGPIQ